MSGTASAWDDATGTEQRETERGAEPARYALVEQMGHRSVTGTVRELTFVGRPMLEVTDLRDGQVRLVGAESLYQVTWISREQAERNVAPPKALGWGGRGDSDEYEYDEDDYKDNMEPGDLTNDILLNAPESFDGDEAAEVIAVRYVRWLESERERLVTLLDEGEPLAGQPDGDMDATEAEVATLRALRKVVSYFTGAWAELLAVLPDSYACHMTCTEAETAADLYRALGDDATAAAIIEAHAAHDAETARTVHYGDSPDDDAWTDRDTAAEDGDTDSCEATL